MMCNSFLEVRILLSSSGETRTLTSKEVVALKEWHNVLIQIRYGRFNYVDDI